MNTNRISIIVHHGDEIVTGHRSLFVEPRFNTWAAIGVGVAVASLGTSVGMAAAGVGQPTQPDLSSSSRQLSNTNAALLPLQRGLTAAQQTGGSYTFSLPSGVNASSLGISETGGGWYDANGNLVSSDPNYGSEMPQATIGNNGKVQSGGSGQTQQPVTQTPQQGGNRSAFNGVTSTQQTGGAQGTQTTPAGTMRGPFRGGLTAGLTWKSGKQTLDGIPITRNPDGTYTVSFKGYGQGDVQSKIADQNAKNQLELSQKYDPQFIAEALKEQNLANPESAAARAEESNLIQEQINRPENSPVSDLLNSQVQDTLDAANNNRLTDMDSERLAAAVAQAQADRGGAGPAGDFSQPLTTGFAGEQRQANAAQAAMGFLASGSSPEDIAYRREQQNLGNLSAEVNGRTPESEFSSISGAQSGPTPMVTASPLPVMPEGQDQAAAQVAIQNAQTTNRFNNNQINPWMQGISSLIDVGSIAGNMGWKPFAHAS
jgi:hypothetical protein